MGAHRPACFFFAEDHEISLHCMSRWSEVQRLGYSRLILSQDHPFVNLKGYQRPMRVKEYPVKVACLGYLIRDHNIVPNSCHYSA